MYLIFFNDPLEQFEFVTFFSIFFSNFVYTILIHFYVLAFLFINYNLFSYNNISYALQILISFVRTTLQSTLIMQTYPHFFYIFYLFIYILLCNLSGMIAYSFTVTSALIITFFFSANFFIGANILTLVRSYPYLQKEPHIIVLNVNNKTHVGFRLL
jgi:F-type H+-transporting ATPase subunit a